jgi:hypothetical protein
MLYREEPGGVLPDALTLSGRAGQFCGIVGREQARKAVGVGRVEELNSVDQRLRH